MDIVGTRSVHHNKINLIVKQKDKQRQALEVPIWGGVHYASSLCSTCKNERAGFYYCSQQITGKKKITSLKTYLIQRSSIGNSHCVFWWSNKCQPQAVFTHTQYMWSKLTPHYYCIGQYTSQLEPLISCIIQSKRTYQARQQTQLHWI